MSIVFDGELNLLQSNGKQVLIDVEEIAAIEEKGKNTSAIVLKGGSIFWTNDSVDTIKQRLEGNEY